MDRPRDEAFKRRKRRNQILIAVAAAAAVVSITVAVAQLEEAAPTVDRQEVWIDTVKRGEMLRRVRGPGTLVPEEIRWLTTSTAGRVERRVLLPGVQVEADTVILELSNPELEQSLEDAKLALKAAEAAYDNELAQLESRYLAQQAEAARIRADYEESLLQAEADERLYSENLIPEINLKRSRLRRDQLAHRDEIEKERLAKEEAANRARLASARAELEQRRALYLLRKEQVESLRVTAGIAGVLQLVPVDVGQRVAPGDNLARVARPDTLKAELRIPETQAKDLTIGQSAEIDTRNGVVPGRVVRIDPSVQEGTVRVDVALEGELPRGARPDLSVDGTIEIERLPDVLYVGRPAYGQPESTIQLFKLVEGGEVAVRVPVTLGKSSVNTIEIREGLSEGDQVILSDISRWDNHNKLRLK
jgi:HlyD family secretion protein